MDHIEKTIEDLAKTIENKEKELLEAKKTLNSLCQMVGKQPLYAIEEKTQSANFGELRGDEYYGKPLATVITKILQKRNAKGIGPASIREIFDEMKAGGYLFETKNDNNSMRGILSSMTKNQKFHKLPTGNWGLKEWYPAAKEPQKDNKAPKKRGRPRKIPQPSVESNNEQEKSKVGRPKKVVQPEAKKEDPKE